MITRELEPIYDSHKSFYHKAFVIYNDPDVLLMSYGTVICTIKDNGKLFMGCDERELSATTRRHLKEFLKQLSHRINDGI